VTEKQMTIIRRAVIGIAVFAILLYLFADIIIISANIVARPVSLRCAHNVPIEEVTCTKFETRTCRKVDRRWMCSPWKADQ
jgi:hypothetical protein